MAKWHLESGKWQLRQIVSKASARLAAAAKWAMRGIVCACTCGGAPACLCPECSPGCVQVTLDGYTDDYAFLNGDYELTRVTCVQFIPGLPSSEVCYGPMFCAYLGCKRPAGGGALIKVLVLYGDPVETGDPCPRRVRTLVWLDGVYHFDTLEPYFFFISYGPSGGGGTQPPETSIDDWCNGVEIEQDNSNAVIWDPALLPIEAKIADATAVITAGGSCPADPTTCGGSIESACPPNCNLCGNFSRLLCFGDAVIPFGVTLPTICNQGAFCLYSSNACPGSHPCNQCTATMSCVVDGGIAYWEITISDILNQSHPCPPGTILFTGPWVFRTPVVRYSMGTDPCPEGCHWTQVSGPTIAHLNCCPASPIVCCT